MPESIDVVIIGAGLAGLTAAREVTKAGYSCVVLEARARVGGRTYTHKLDKGIVDLGAAWINDTNQSQMFALAEELKLELIEQNTTGNAVLLDHDGSAKPFPYGKLPPFDDETTTHLAHIRDTVEADCQKLSAARPTSTHLDSITFAAYVQSLGASPLALSIASIWTRAMVGQEPEDVSALLFLNYCKCGGGLLQMRSDQKGGGQHLRIRTGTQSFSEGLKNMLPAGTVRLSSPVDSITQQGDGHVLVTTQNTPDMPLLARKVITSVPGPALKHITFTPPLSPAKRLLIDSFRYGFYQKVMIVFKTCFWAHTTGIPNCGLIQSFSDLHPAAVVRDTSSPLDDKHVLTFFVAGNPGRAWSALPKPEREEALFRQAADAFLSGDLARLKSEVVEVIDFEWRNEHWNGYGCPSPCLAPGVWSAIESEGGAEVLAQAAGNVHFVGTETSDVWRGYMEGAVRSGARGAREVLADLKR
ncbi:Amine oxidase [flavin-containing] [Cyphellophora attinorum]|uniref:Amine oxidase n=1 Tax=Cyphellophora attinorum TaxID=1664694 RepID=A0A0N1HB59_9EURO|nr:Amine oxidase [flavin-containing] [Phialophora attinorum]KPI45655.1 Amine oxidase [flavin-containing] [Phialophora attinorum]